MHPTLSLPSRIVVWCAAASAVLIPVSASAQQTPVATADWVSIATNVDLGYHHTQFFEPDYRARVLQWDSRLSFWLPPSRQTFAWGPYLRLAGIKSSRNEAWENGWLGVPGIGLQLYPFSSQRFRGSTNSLGAWLGPLRGFAEYNIVNYWGVANTWRPKRQTRLGFDYWRALYVNDRRSPWWAELWTGLYRQSSNEFTESYDTTIFANAARVGVRKPRSGLFSSVSPYVAVESSKTRNKTFYWENRVLAGGGVRFVPSPIIGSVDISPYFSRIVVYAEFLKTTSYYGDDAPNAIPRAEFRFGVSFNVGAWYK